MFATVILPAPPLQKDVPLAHIKIWISAYFRESSEIHKNGKGNPLYKIRTIAERAIDHLQINMCVAERKSCNRTTTKADVFLAGIASQLTVIVAHSMNCPQYIRSLKPLIA